MHGQGRDVPDDRATTAASVRANRAMPYRGPYQPAQAPARARPPSTNVTPSDAGISRRANAPPRVPLIRTATGPRGGAAASRPTDSAAKPATVGSASEISGLPAVMPGSPKR